MEEIFLQKRRERERGRKKERKEKLIDSVWKDQRFHMITELSLKAQEGPKQKSKMLGW